VGAVFLILADVGRAPEDAMKSRFLRITFLALGACITYYFVFVASLQRLVRAALYGGHFVPPKTSPRFLTLEILERY
jgi:hypothetical protein